MKKNAVGFYWTLPVPWAGFAKLPDGIEEAAKASRTIRYQRALIHEFAERNGLNLVHEAAFLEIDPDRGSEFIHDALDKAAAKCRLHSASLLFVDFAGVQGWRSHEPMLEWLRRSNIVAEPIEASPIGLDGQDFDPHEHFANWRHNQREWTMNKGKRAEAAIGRILELRSLGLKNPAIAEALNAERVLSLSGKAWSADGVRKFVATYVC